MGKRSFAEILERWESSLKSGEESSDGGCVERKPCTDCRSESSAPSRSFADIYYAWERTHDEKDEIDRRVRISERSRRDDVTINRLRRMDAQDELDLHEMKLEEAKVATKQFLDRSFGRGYRKVSIITGKGLHSKGGEAVLRPAVSEICKSHPQVREVLVPKASDGGSGALAVIFKASPSRR